MLCRAPRPVCLVAFLAVAFALSCASRDNRKPVHPVTGQVLWKGKPVVGAQVIFHPVDKENFERERPHAEKTDADGRFRLSTYLKDDGAPEGEYIVAVVLQPEGPDDGSDQRSKNL